MQCLKFATRSNARLAPPRLAGRGTGGHHAAGRPGTTAATTHSRHQQRPDCSGWEAWLRKRLDDDWRFRTKVIGQALGQALDGERKVSRDALAVEVQRLRMVLADVQKTIAALNNLRVAERDGKPADLMCTPLSTH